MISDECNLPFLPLRFIADHLSHGQAITEPSHVKSRATDTLRPSVRQVNFGVVVRSPNRYVLLWRHSLWHALFKVARRCFKRFEAEPEAGGQQPARRHSAALDD